MLLCYVFSMQEKNNILLSEADQRDYKDMVQRTNVLADSNGIAIPQVLKAEGLGAEGGADENGDPYVAYGNDLIRGLSPEARDYIAAHETAHTLLGNRILMLQGNQLEAELAADRFAAQQPNFSASGAREALERLGRGAHEADGVYLSNEERVRRMIEVHEGLYQQNVEIPEQQSLLTEVNPHGIEFGSLLQRFDLTAFKAISGGISVAENGSNNAVGGRSSSIALG